MLLKHLTPCQCQTKTFMTIKRPKIKDCATLDENVILIPPFVTTLKLALKSFHYSLLLESLWFLRPSHSQLWDLRAKITRQVKALSIFINFHQNAESCCFIMTADSDILFCLAVPTRLAFSHTWLSLAILNSAVCPPPSLCVGSFTSREYFPAMTPTPSQSAATKHCSLIFKSSYAPKKEQQTRLNLEAQQSVIVAHSSTQSCVQIGVGFVLNSRTLGYVVLSFPLPGTGKTDQTLN